MDSDHENEELFSESNDDGLVDDKNNDSEKDEKDDNKSDSKEENSNTAEESIMVQLIQLLPKFLPKHNLNQRLK